MISIQSTVSPDCVWLSLPLRTWGPNGSHGHWSQQAKRRRDLKTATLLALRTEVGQVAPFVPAVIVITRVGTRKMDTDNAAYACKGLRDGVAEWLGIDDGDERLTWIYKTRQSFGFAVEVEMKKESAL